jgi:hypothetical protein
MFDSTNVFGISVFLDPGVSLASALTGVVCYRPEADIVTAQQQPSRPQKGRLRGHIGEKAGVGVFVALFTEQCRHKLPNNHRAAGYLPKPRSDV